MSPQTRAAQVGAKLKLSWRVGITQWEHDDAFEMLLELLGKRRRIVDEAALFDSITHHLYIPLDKYAGMMNVASRRMEALRSAGIGSVGINVLCTIGHINEGWSYMPPLPFQPMVGHDGSVSRSCACPNTVAFRAYIRSKYEIVAKARPDFIWVDDDIRMHHHGVAWGCFCSTCLATFARSAGRAYNREELLEAFNDPAQGRLRELWVEQNIAALESLLAEIRDVIVSVDGKIEIGLMTAGPGWTTYSGQALDRWFAALGATKARPGGGFYSDDAPREMLVKVHECGRQRASLPPFVTEIQYELENFPYQRLKKSATALVDECSLALAHGMNGIAFNVMGTPTYADDFAHWMEAVLAARSLWEKWLEIVGRLSTSGLWPAWTPGLVARRKVRPNENWLSWSDQHNINQSMVLAEIGIPLASDRCRNPVVLCGRIAEALSDDEVRSFLASGVLMDSTALGVLEERGLAHLAGVKIAKRLDNGVMERFTDDTLNGSAAGKLRDARIEFWGDATGMGDVLEPSCAGVRVLTVIEDYFARPVGPGMTAFENELGGRVVVMGYAPWIFLHSAAKRLQLQNVADWIGRDALPVRVEEPVSLVPVARVAEDRKRAGVMLLNAGMDEIAEATISIRIRAQEIFQLAVGKRVRVLEHKYSYSGVVIRLRDIEPWGLRIILVGD